MSSVLAGRGSKSKSKSLETDRGRAHLKVGSQRPNDYLQRPKDLAPVPKPTETVLVAVNAAKEITKHALEWALTNVAQEGDHITLLALLPGARNVRRIWGLPMLAGDCANASAKNVHIPGNHQDIEEQIGNSCFHVMQELHKLCDTKKVKVSVKVVQSAGKGTTAMEAHRVGATWVVLDRQLKKEEKCCLEKLQCNLVIVKPFSPKIVRLNLNGSPKDAGKGPCEVQGCDGSAQDGPSNTRKGNFPASDEATPSSSPETDAPFTTTEQGTSSNSSSEPATSPPTSSETHAHKTSDYKCADSSPREDDAGAEAISETGTASDSSLVDAVSESDSGESGPLCTTTSESPEPTSFKFPVGFSRPFDPMAQSWFESRRAGAQLDSVSVELWKTSARRRPDSATGTPKANSKQGRTSTPASPLNAAKKLSGNGRLSFSMREGSSSRNLGANPHPVNSPLGTSLKNGVVSHRRLPPEFIKSTRQPFGSERVAGVSRRLVTAKDLLEKFSEWDQEAGIEYGQSRPRQGELERTSSVRKAVSLSRHVPAGPPPLCSICQHKAPVFGKPPRRFTFEELELATGGFSQANFLAEGGFGSVHRGVLPDGQAVAVKQHKLASSQGDIEFCSEVEVLSCAQHRNVVMLNGYCIEDKRRLLVYEFICNGSLDSHLYGRDRDALEWPARQKIAVGAARGLRYLHEECRVGCIVHRDMRPNNILLTHDFEPMVGDFGLARWQPDGDLGVQTRVLGTFGYLAPEYAQSGQITEKADVYSFGVVLLELVTGRKAVDLNRPKGQQCLTEWARPLLEVRATEDMIDPRLDGYYSDYEVYCMLHAASLCIRKDPHLRPRMSQVLRILEGDIIIDTSGSSTPLYSSKLAYDHAAAYGSRSSRISSEYVVSRLGALSPPPLISYSGSIAGEAMVGHSGKLSLCGKSIGKLSYQALKAAYKDRGNVRRLSYEDL